MIINSATEIRFLKLTFLLLAFCYSSQFFSQEQDYSPIVSKGEVPSVFLKSVYDSYLYDLSKNPKAEDNQKQEALELFLQGSNLGFNQLLWSGKTIYGDLFSSYINKVGNYVLTAFPELKDEIQFYTFKSSSINAFATGKGAIFINVGLLANIDNEAQLAFILCHEIIHYKNRHSFNKFSERYDLFNKSNKDDLLNYDSKVDLLFKFSKNYESEADSLGIIAYNKLGYSSNAVVSTLEKLYYSYLPIENIKFDYTLLGFPDFIFPSKLKLDSVKRISKIKVESDLFVTHPNVFSRIKNAQNLLKDNLGQNMPYKAADEIEFLEMSKNARFELVNLLLVGKEYAKAIYTIYILQKEFGESQYLELSILKAFYGVSKYKTKEELHRVIKGYYSIEGESQKIAYLLKKISKVQLNTLSIKMCYNYLLKYPNSIYVQRYYESLIKDFTIDLNQDISNYNSTIVNYNEEDFEKKYHLNLLAPMVENQAFQNLCVEYKDELKLKNNKEKLSYKELIKLEKKENSDILKNGLNEKVNKIIVLDPICFINSKKGKHEFIESITEKNKLDDLIISIAKKRNIEMLLLSSSKAGVNFDVESFILLNEWVEERDNHSKFDIVPLQSDYIENVIKKFETKYIYRIYLYVNGKESRSIVMSELINMETGVKLIGKRKVKRGTFSDSILQQLLEEDFKLIEKSK